MLKKGRPQQEKEEDPQEMCHGSVGQDSPIEHLGEEMGMTETEEEEEEEAHHPLPEETWKNETMGRS